MPTISNVLRGAVAAIAAAGCLSAVAGSIQLVKDINRTVNTVGDQMAFAVAGGKWVVPFANDATAMPWVTDGSAEGTRNLARTWAADSFVKVGDKVYFTAAIDEATAGQKYLWRTDGTVEGTVRLTLPLPSLFLEALPVAFGDRLVLTQFRGGLHITDGTPGGTIELAAGPIVSQPRVAGALIYFSRYDFSSDAYQLWKSDGTVAGTALLSQIAEGDGYFDLAMVVGDRLLYKAGAALWSTDGTPAGTQQLASLGAQASVSSPLVLGGIGYFMTSTTGAQADIALWRTDGTSAGTSLVTTVGPYAEFAASDSLLYIVRGASQYSQALWTSDGTAAGTQLLLPATGYVGRLFAAGNVMYFNRTTPSTPYTVWRTQGTPASTTMLPNSELLYPLAPLGERMILNGGQSLWGETAWITDGTEEGTYPLLTADGDPNRSSTCGANYAAVDPGVRFAGSVYFWADDGIHGCEVWKSDGTAAGTQLLKDINPGRANAYVRPVFSLSYDMVAMGGHLYFGAGDGTAGPQLWRTDGTEGGTTQVAAVPGVGQMAASATQVFFITGEYGQVWRSNGTAAGTYAISNSSQAPHPENLSTAGEHAYFSAESTTTTGNRDAWWGSNGTPGGTVLLVDGMFVNPSMRTASAAGKFIFRNTIDLNPWISSGTVAGTKRLVNTNLGVLATLGNRAILIGGEGSANGIWTSDGTAAGTTFTSPLSPDFSYSLNPIEAGPRLYFLGDDGLVSTDGTPAGTHLLVGAMGCCTLPAPLDGDGTRFFFTAYGQGTYGVWLGYEPGGARRVPSDAPYSTPTSWFRTLPSGGLMLMSSAAGVEPHFIPYASVPPPLAFAPRQGVAPNATITSEPALMQGLAASTTINASNGQVCVSSAANCSCDVAAFSASAAVSNGQYVCARHESASTSLATVRTAIVFDGGESSLVSTTASAAAASLIEFLTDVTAVESGANALVRVVRSGALDSQVGVSWKAVAGTATQGVDFGTAGSTVPIGGTLVFMPGETQKIIEVGPNDVAGAFVRILPDGRAEANETFTLTLTAPAGDAALGARNVVTITIASAEPAVGMADALVTAQEQAGYAFVKVMRYGATTAPMEVSYTTANGTAKAGIDYTAVSGTLTWSANDSYPQYIYVPIADDAIANPTRSFTVSLARTGGSVVVGAVTRVDIVSDEVPVLPAVSFYSGAQAMSEDSPSITVLVRRIGPATGTASVKWTAANGTATAGQDYGSSRGSAAPAGTLSWGAGDTAPKSIVIPILKDAAAEGTETFTITLSAPSAGTGLGSPSSLVVSIVEGAVPADAAIAVTPPKLVVLEGGPVAVLTVTRQPVGGDFTTPSMVTYATVAGTALAGPDFTTQSGILTWEVADGSSRTLTIPITNDAIAESPESFRITFAAASSGTRVDTPEVSVTILDDDELFPPHGAIPDGWTVPAGAAQGWHVSNDAGAYEGVFSLRSDQIDDNQSAQLEVTRVFASGNITFRVKVSSELTFDHLRFFVDDIEKGTWSGTAVAGWQVASIPVTAGTHTIRWSYEKDASASVGQDAAWIDAVVLP